jgi:hypothetical protein
MVKYSPIPPPLSCYLDSVPEDALDPCDSGIAEGGSLKKYRQRVHAVEVPHVSYASKVSCESDPSSSNLEETKASALSEVLSACDRYVANQRAREMLVNVSIEDLDNESYRTWMDCTQSVFPPPPPSLPTSFISSLCPVSKMGLAYRFNTKALTQGVLCLPHMLSEGDEPFTSCHLKKLKILILHNHCPLFTRYVLPPSSLPPL